MVGETMRGNGIAHTGAFTSATAFTSASVATRHSTTGVRPCSAASDKAVEPYCESKACVSHPSRALGIATRLTRSLAWTSAPLHNKYCTTAKWPALAAHSNAVESSCAMEDKCVLRRQSWETRGRRQVQSRTLFLASMSAPACNKHSTGPTWPLCAASSSAVDPSW